MNTKELAETLVSEVRSFVARSLEKRDARIEALEFKIAKLEAASGKAIGNLADAFAGAYLPGHTYGRGQLVQHRGSTWLALEDACGRPGETAAWRMLVKAGRDAR